MTVTTTYSVAGAATTSVTTNFNGTQRGATIVAQPSGFSGATSSNVLFIDAATNQMLLQRVDHATGGLVGPREVLASNVALAVDAAGQALPVAAIQLTADTIAYTWQTTGVPSNIEFAIFNTTTSTVVASGIVDAVTQDALHPDIALLDNGTFVIVYERAFSATDHDVLARVYNTAGVAQTANFSIDNSGASFDAYPSVNALQDGLNDGRFIVGYTRTNTTTGDTSIYQGEFLNTGTISVAPALIDANGTVNRGIQYATGSTESMAFWEDSSWTGSTTNTSVSALRLTGGNAGQTQGTGTAGNDVVTGAATGNSGFTTMVYTNTFSATDFDALGRIYFNDGTTPTLSFTIANSAGADETSAQIAWINGGQFRVVFNNDLALAGDADAGIATRLFTMTRTSNGDGANDYIDFGYDDVNDIINAGGGNDDIFSGYGVDTINGGDGNDYIETYAVATIDGGSGDDTILAFNTSAINAGIGTDRVDIFAVPVSADGGSGTDALYIELLGSSAVSINLANMWSGGSGTIGSGSVMGFESLRAVGGTNFNDTIVLGAAAVLDQFFSVAARDGDDVVIGSNSDDQIDGGTGNDSLSGGAGNDALIDSDTGTLIGGTGDDRYEVGSRNHSIVEVAGEGYDTVVSGVATFVLQNNVEELQFTSVTNVLGIGNSGGNRIFGVTGSRDELYGLGGDDTLVDNGGAVGFEDTMLGGTGNDLYLVTVRGSSTIELANEGDDTVQTDFSVYGLQANIERLTAIGNGPHDALVGNNLDNVITGGTAADGLYGREGNDTLIGGIGTANTLLGQEGNDRYEVQTLGDSVIEFANEGIDFVAVSLGTVTSYTLTANVEDLAYFGTGDFTGIGNTGNNQLFGGTGADFLSGLDGNDFLDGNSGNDTLLGGAGNDTFFYFGGETGLDRILDFTSGSDRIGLSVGAFAQTGPLQLVQSGTPVATTANSTFLYNVNNGVLSYDADGTGAGAAVVLAQLNAGLTLAIGDFFFG